MFQILDFRLHNVNETLFADAFITCSTGEMKYFLLITFTNLNGILKKISY
jgi:hypothetical protein